MHGQVLGMAGSRVADDVVIHGRVRSSRMLPMFCQYFWLAANDGVSSSTTTTTPHHLLFHHPADGTLRALGRRGADQ